MSSPLSAPEIVPVTGIRDAIRWRNALAEAITNLIKDYEKRVPFAQVDSIKIERREVTSRIGGKRTTLQVIPRVHLTEER
jgi:hypothetical protein